MTDALCDSRQPLRRLSVLYAGAFAVLVAATHRLWLGSTDFPQAPAFQGLTSLPQWVDRALLAGLAVVALAGCAMRRWAALWIGVALFALASFAMNQHRGQVWAYHLCVAGLVTTFSRPASALTRLRWLTISIYAWSAVSKLDAGFVTGPGQMLLRGLTEGLSLGPLPAGLQRVGPWMMPIGELATAVALAIPRFRQIGLWLSIVMHVLLLIAIGPFGLGHELGVQIWNVVFLIQNVLLFRQRASLQAVSDHVPRPAGRWVGGVLAAVIALPALQLWGYWDLWPSWAVYSTRGGWTTIFVHHEEIGRLPASAQRFVGPPPPLSDWHPVDLDAWSLNELHCPVYPQGRFRLAAAASLSRTARIQVERRTAPNRVNGATTVQTVDVQDGELPAEVAAEFWLNTRPRMRSREGEN